MSYFPWLTILVVLPIFAGSLIFFLPHKGNKIVRWYTISICLLEFLLMTYAFCYHFQLEDPLIQLKEDYKWIDVLDFPLEIGNRWTFIRIYFIDRIYHYFSYFSSLANYPEFAIILFPDARNV